MRKRLHPSNRYWSFAGSGHEGHAECLSYATARKMPSRFLQQALQHLN